MPRARPAAAAGVCSTRRAPPPPMPRTATACRRSSTPAPAPPKPGPPSSPPSRRANRKRRLLTVSRQLTASLMVKEFYVNTTYSKGTYQAEVLDQGFEESAAKGTPAFFLQLMIVGRYDTEGQLQDCPRYEPTHRQYLANETGLNILKGELKALGVQVTDLAQLDRSVSGHISLVGRKIDVTCDIETYLGKPRERWSIPRP